MATDSAGGGLLGDPHSVAASARGECRCEEIPLLQVAAAVDDIHRDHIATAAPVLQARKVQFSRPFLIHMRGDGVRGQGGSLSVVPSPFFFCRCARSCA